MNLLMQRKALISVALSLGLSAILLAPLALADESEHGAQMDHKAMAEGMNSPKATAPQGMPMNPEAMNHGAMDPNMMDHGAMGHGSMGNGSMGQGMMNGQENADGDEAGTEHAH